MTPSGFASHKVRVILVVLRQTIGDSMKEPFVAIVVSVPDEQFSDDDDICRAACNFVCTRLEKHLTQNGHSVPSWSRGGCHEDWGAVIESQLNETTYRYHIYYGPGQSDNTLNQMLIQYQRSQPILNWLFGKSSDLLPDDPLHETMESFGRLFSASRMLTRTQFGKEY